MLWDVFIMCFKIKCEEWQDGIILSYWGVFVLIKLFESIHTVQQQYFHDDSCEPYHQYPCSSLHVNGTL